MISKIQYLNEFIEELIKRYENDVGDIQNNDMSMLKILKLLFLWAAENQKALEIFDKFEARPLGPVEVDVYNAIKDNDENLSFQVNHTNLTRKTSTFKWRSDPIIAEMVKRLKEKNPNLIKSSASQLVDITHKWDCWIIPSLFREKKISTSLILASKPHYF